LSVLAVMAAGQFQPIDERNVAREPVKLGDDDRRLCPPA
jgi:hypothetical protein